MVVGRGWLRVWRNGAAEMQAVGLQGSSTRAHTHAVGARARVRLPRVTRICAKAVPGGIFGSNGLYVRVAGIDVLQWGEDRIFWINLLPDFFGGGIIILQRVK